MKTIEQVIEEISKKIEIDTRRTIHEHIESSSYRLIFYKQLLEWIKQE